MAYQEPYPVITQWPGTENHNPGLKRCFHYTLTYDQVKANYETAFINSTRSNVGLTAFLSGLGIGALTGTTLLNTGVPVESYYMKN